MKRTVSIAGLVFLAGLALGGCGNGNDGNGPGNPPPPALSANQIDRMGRAGVNTAVTNPFFREGVATEKEAHEEILDEYNAAADSGQWVDLFKTEMAGNLAILDSLDTVCGNQLLATQGNGQPKAGRYDALAGVLADDVLYVNTGSGSCRQYLAVEANAIGVANTDCGGRTPLEDTIDVTYVALAAGALCQGPGTAAPCPVTDGIARDNDGTASLTVFPFLAPPNS